MLQCISSVHFEMAQVVEAFHVRDLALLILPSRYHFADDISSHGNKCINCASYATMFMYVLHLYRSGVYCFKIITLFQVLVLLQ